MARLFLMAAFTLTLMSCNNDGDSGTTENSADSPATQYRGVENVNGNIPDSTNTGAEPMSNTGTDSTE